MPRWIRGGRDMGAAVPIRMDIEAAEMRGLARHEADGRVAARLLGLANVLDGMSRKAAARRRGDGPPDAAVQRMR